MVRGTKKGWPLRTVGRKIGRWTVAKPWTQRGGHALMVFDTEVRGADAKDRYVWFVWSLKPKQTKVGHGRAPSQYRAEQLAQEFIANERNH